MPITIFAMIQNDSGKRPHLLPNAQQRRGSFITFVPANGKQRAGFIRP
jgi:hypothetical protein